MAKLEGTKRISELVEGAQLFDSSGYSLVKVTKKGIAQLIELPIRSTGVAEYMDELSGKAPKPPVRKEVIKKNSIEGRELNLPHDKMMQVFDFTDETYIDAIEKHNEDFTWRVVIFALDIGWKKTDGSPAQTFEEKKGILKSNRITWNHILQVFEDVKNLTQLQEDREDFLQED